MRLAHLADPHLGFRKYARLTPRGHNQREVDVAEAFVRAIDGVIAARPDAVLVAGDIFHQVRPTNSAILLAMRQFTRLVRELPDAPVVVIAGNHDTPRSSDTVSIFGLLHELGVHVASDAARRFEFPALDLSVLAVPHQALFASPRPALERAGEATHQVLMLHGETPGLFGPDRSTAEPGGALLDDAELAHAAWSYVALGHYHVQHRVRDRIWYAGALDYVSPNPWGEVREERAARVAGKGWLLVDLDTGEVRPQPIAAPRRVLDLPVLDASDLAAPELDRLLAEAVEAVPGGIDGAVVRQVVREVPRAVARELDHGAIRQWKAAALDFLLDLRAPERRARLVGVGAPGSSPATLPETLEGFLRARHLPAGMDRDLFVAEGMAALAAASTDGEGD
ncbi:MAG: exonuclease SbcCD subunit D [Gemmatimonadales bacterium]|nr:metallophosphoesterase [Gemmatimonadales bacterium]